MRTSLRIDSRSVGPGNHCLFIAEAGVNHNGDLDLAFKLIDAAVEAGADAVKFQTFSADALASKSAKKADYQSVNTGDGNESQYEMLKSLELPRSAFKELKEYCKQKEILFLSTPFDLPSLALLEEINVPAYKVASGETVNPPLIRAIAKTGKPMLMSTGMCTLDEVRRAVEMVRAQGNKKIALFHCVSNYPASPGSLNLRAMKTMEDAFGIPVGFSDHSLGIDALLAAVLLGASLVEKHFTLDRSMPGPDHKASLEPVELKEAIKKIRGIEGQLGRDVPQGMLSKNILNFNEMLGDGIKRPAKEEENTMAVARKSVHASIDIPQGTAITEAMITTMRPMNGIPSLDFDVVIGKKAKRKILMGQPIVWNDI